VRAKSNRRNPAGAGARDAGFCSISLGGRDLLHRLQPQELAAQDREHQERRWLRFSRNKWDGGYDIEGHLDPVSGTIVKTALEGLLGPAPRNDPRGPLQRRGDALTEICQRVLDSGTLPERGRQRPHITVTATLETLRGDPGAPAALLDWGFPISAEILREIASDADLTPILLSKGGDPLHVGRKYRTSTPRMHRAMSERDRGCIWPGCDRPPEWCQAHHRDRKWTLGGLTNIEEMGLACLPHHRLLDQGWRLVRGPDGQVEAVPPEPRQPLYGPAVYEPPPQIA